MADTQELYADEYGKILLVSGEQRIEIRWTDKTANIDATQFMAWLTRFAELIETHEVDFALVDARGFRMPPGNMDMAWRDENIIPRYNAAGIKKFAFIMPQGMPAIGAPPAPDGPASFPTAYFAEEESAMAWLRPTL